ncbi:chemotaxis protein [Alkalilimnicola ehrlichii]|uniref:Chemotaxis protein n=1 Tax=Alkalilimnicola ehrlichii TaxID=351052 RepID=A0A3E0WI15_9GAMM|nr:methyl-accepting chemotaxis protein [Alkalilimnicola ehrlichii]RFA25526.1 chemotaxis protein [Alkalilimnicola ehrlichii]RFA32620.1 chemotaxis protein [Alkalilimnicola ehrlichii]
MRVTIRTRILLLALVPLIVVATLLTTYNLLQSRATGQQAVDRFAEQMMSDRRHELRNYLQLAFTSIEHLRERPDALTNPEVQEEAKQILRRLRFDDAGDIGYIFVYDRNGVNIAHGVNPALEGRNLIGFQDPNGVYLIRELLAAANRGGGFVEYAWENPDRAVGPKLAYAAMLEEWGWAIGTGFWVEGLHEQIEGIESGVHEALGAAFVRSLLAALGSVLGIAALAVVVARSINAPLRRSLTAMHDVARGDGDLTRRLNIDTRDEFRELAGAFNAFADQVGGLVRGIRESASSITGSTRELNRIMEEVERGVNRQQDESAQAASAIHQLTAASHQVAESAQYAAVATDKAERQVEAAQALLERAITVINGLADRVETGVSVVDKLGEESENIGGVLDVIRGIAEQTNLLALNAAIEAARAGDAGRGFAVVADEVRTLASRTQTSTQEIQGMIERLQAGAQEVTQVIEGVRDRSRSTVEEARQVEDALATVLDAVNTINTQNAQIASAAEEQTAMSDAVNQNMQQIVAIIEQTGNGTRRVGEHTRSLAQTNSELAAKVSRYRI